MKVNEIMIGDWFYDTLSQNNKKVNRGDFEINPLNGICYSENLYPIPLTAEILEKNGFIKDTDEDDRVVNVYHLLVPTGYERNSYTIQVNLYKEPICGVSTLVKCWGWIPPHNGGLNDIHLCSANYVHQLQHAMRLCGIEKEIEL